MEDLIESIKIVRPNIIELMLISSYILFTYTDSLANNILYRSGGAMVAHLAHYQETTFESFGCNQRSVGVSPFSKMPDSVNMDFVSFNYHWR